MDFYTGSVDRFAAAAFPQLTPRERDVLALLANGSRNSEIARRLGLTDKTVRNHVSTILLKLNAPDRTAAALKARDAGL
jgi:DNA-binding NarL/FixJ family response regulator